jgi:heat shock protein HslJ
MNKKIIPAMLGALAVVLVITAIVLTQTARPQASPAGPETDPQKLLIPRWFLSALTLDGQTIEIPAGQQTMTIQFEEGDKANGTGGCNSFGADYQAGKDGRMSFGPIMSTMMACADGMQQETAYFQALAKVQQFRVEGVKLTLSSQDGKTSLVYRMPPK